MHKTNSTLQTRHRPIGKILTIAVMAAFSGSLLLGAWQALLHRQSMVVIPLSSESAVEDRLVINDEIDVDPFEPEHQIIFSRAKSEKISRMAAAFQKFKNEMTVATHGLDNSSFLIDDTFDRLTSFKSCFYLTYLMAKDFFTGGSAADKIFIAEAEELDRITSTAVTNAKQAIDRLSVALTIIEDSYSETLIAGPGTIAVATGMPSDSLAVQEQVEETRQRELLRTVVFDSSLGSVSALLSATAFAHSANRSAWTLLAAVKKKAAKRMSIAAFPALLDGPLPFGDIITLTIESGCLVWSFYQVYNGQAMLTHELKREVSAVITQNSKQIRDWGMSVGNDLMETAALSMPVPVVAKAHSGKGKWKPNGIDRSHRF